MGIELAIAAVKNLLEADPRIAAALLFGSAARGRARASSDLDIGVVAASAADADALQAEQLELVGRLSAAAGRDVQLVVLDRADAVLGHQAFSTGRTLFERDSARKADVLERVLTEYFDGEYHRRLRREALDSRHGRVVVDRDVVLRKPEAIEHHTTRLRAKLPLRPEALQENESLLNDVCFDLLQALQACIDLAVHACSHEALGGPESPAAAFALLAQHRIIGAPLAGRMTKAAGLRNLIVHRYAELDLRRLAPAVAEGLPDLDEFAAALRAHAG